MKRPIAILVAACLLPVMSRAQDSSLPDTTTGGLTVRTHPSGATVMVHGPVTVTGISPTVFHHRLAGDYRVKVRKHLYQSQSRTVSLQLGQQQTLDLNLTPKTRTRALVRSVFIPGWGQYYSEQDFKAGLFLTAAAGSIIGFLVANNTYQKDNDSYHSAYTSYKLAVERGAANDDLERLYSAYQSAKHDADHSYKIRRTFIGVVAGVWALNLADAVFFFPKLKPEAEVQGVNVTPSASLGSVGLTLTKRF